MNRQKRNFRLFNLLLTFCLTACVTVDMGQNKAEKSKDVSYTEPAPPFVKIKSKVADVVWEEPSTGSSIAYLTECNPQIDPSIAEITESYLQSLKEASIVSQQKQVYNSREAVELVFTAKYEGITNQSKMLIFRKNSCTYTLTYMSLQKHYAQYLSHFDQFIKEFQAP